MNVSIIGCGWLGLPLGIYLTGLGFKVSGSTTSTEKLAEIRKNGIKSYLIEVKDTIQGNYDGFFNTDVLIINIPPGRRNPNVVKDHPTQVRLLLERAKYNKVKHIVFISSTGVYQDSRKLMDEESHCVPSRSSGQALLSAESIIRASGMKWTILRMAGLAGKNREPGKWFAGKVDVPYGDTPVNMIHLDDCIAAIRTVIEAAPTNDIFNLCANEHPVKKDFYAVQAIKAGEKPPEFTVGIGPHKIVDNSKFKKKFDYEYRFPDPIHF